MKTKYKIIGGILLIGLIAFWCIGRNLFFDAPIDDDAFDSFGSFVGGTIGTFFAAVAVYYAWLTFKKETIKNRFYEMLRQHNNNVKYLEIEGVDSFEKYIGVLKKIYITILSIFNERGFDVINRYDSIYKLSYLYFFYGTSLNPDDTESSLGISPEEIELMNQYFRINNIKFEGHSLELGIYFRQLYQVVTYINEQNILTYKEKYEYIKSIRVCLNLNEQYLLFLNSLSTLGDIWELRDIKRNEWDRHLITKYNLLKNIPKSYLNKFPRLNFAQSYRNIYYEYMTSDDRRDRVEWEKRYT